MRRLLVVFFILVAIAALFLLAIQLIPVDRTNPPVVTQVKWDSPQTKALWDRACADCHSNETTWPWYSYVAPVSWLVARDVNEGRQRFNISDMNAPRNREGGEGGERGEGTEDVGETIAQGQMPPAIYILIHPTAQLSQAEKQALIAGLEQTLRSTQASR